MLQLAAQGEPEHPPRISSVRKLAVPELLGWLDGDEATSLAVAESAIASGSSC
jgi:hypothetical protein